MVVVKSCVSGFPGGHFLLFFFFFLREGLFNEMMILLLRCGGALTWLSLQLVGVVVVAEEEDEI